MDHRLAVLLQLLLRPRRQDEWNRSVEEPALLDGLERSAQVFTL